MADQPIGVETKMGRLDKRVAIVTGAAQGIGAVYAKGMAAEGAHIVVADVLDTAKTVAAIEQAGGRALGVRADVTDEAAVGAMVAAAVETFGKLDILVANAGLFADLTHRSFVDIPEAEWDRVMAINVKGIWLCCRAAVPEMRKQGYGKIVNISSGTVMMGTTHLLHYVTSKGAVIALTRALAREVGDDNICVNAIAPGLTMSEKLLARGERMVPGNQRNIAMRSIKRSQTPEDLLGAVVFLSSSASDFMTGQTMVVDGGAVMH